VAEAEVDRLTAEYEDLYTLAPALRKGGEQRANLRDAARQEIGCALPPGGGFRRVTPRSRSPTA